LGGGRSSSAARRAVLPCGRPASAGQDSSRTASVWVRFPDPNRSSSTPPPADAHQRRQLTLPRCPGRAAPLRASGLLVGRRCCEVGGAARANCSSREGSQRRLGGARSSSAARAEPLPTHTSAGSSPSLDALAAQRRLVVGIRRSAPASDRGDARTQSGRRRRARGAGRGLAYVSRSMIAGARPTAGWRSARRRPRRTRRCRCRRRARRRPRASRRSGRRRSPARRGPHRCARPGAARP
jgi:hypothetical protein